MARYAPRMMELAPRDIVARSIQTEINEGRGFDGGYVHLDLRHLGKARILERLPGIRQICIEFAGLDPVDEPIPIQPGQHYSMGGIDTDVRGRTTHRQFLRRRRVRLRERARRQPAGRQFAADTVVFGRLVAEDIDARRGDFVLRARGGGARTAPARQTAQLEAMLGRGGGVPSTKSRESLRALLTEQVGIFRQESELADAVRADSANCASSMPRWAAARRSGPFNFEILQVLELESLLYVAEVIAQGRWRGGKAAARISARDYPARNDAPWLKHTLARLDGGEIGFSYADVDTSHA